ncbi:MAG: DUF3426 domain-containing protein [Syntrophus sp. (in: bacteria)]
MIIQCRVCRTKYHFDEAKIPPDGAWVRCTRCQKVFFQHPPLLPLEVNKLEVSDQTVAADLKTVDMHNLDEIQDFPEISELSEARPHAKRIWVWVLSGILLVMAAGGGSLFLFPEYGQMAIRELNALFPGMASFTAQEAPAPLIGPAQVKIVDVKQRFVSNALLGNIRIIEGVAMNASPYPMARIKVRGELSDMSGTLVRESSAFCGNLLTDEELGIMSEEQIFRELANPQGSDVPNDKIAPNGTILFMMVFLREPPGVTKTFVMPIAAERLLSS